MDDAGEILQNKAVFSEMDLGTQTYSPMPLCENQQKVYGTVFAKDNEKRKKKDKSERMTLLNTSKMRLRRCRNFSSLHFMSVLNTKYVLQA